MPVLSYWQKYAFEENNDFAYIEVRRVGSSSWQRLYYTTGTSASWTEEQVDLSEYAGDQVDLRFRTIANTNGTQSDGWQIDDIRIGETQATVFPYPFTDDLESSASLGNWHTTSWELVPDSHSGTLGITDSPKGNYGTLVNSSMILASACFCLWR